MTAAAAFVLVACLLLVVAGIGKLRRPAATVGALRSVGAPGSRPAVRLLGGAEIALGVATAATGGGLLTALVALSYLCFTGFVVVALRRGGAVSSCGCLGRPDTPPTVTHALVTAALAIGCAAAAVAGGGGLVDLAVTPATAAMLAFTALAAWLAWLAFAVLPHVRLTAAQPTPSQER